MAVFQPFRAVRPVPARAAEVAALPYDVMNSDEAREMVKGNPVSFLHVDKAEIDLPRDRFETWDASSNTMRVQPGQYEVMVGNSSAASALKSIKVKTK